jgi:hypothetical protein
MAMPAANITETGRGNAKSKGLTGGTQVPAITSPASSAATPSNACWRGHARNSPKTK